MYKLAVAYSSITECSKWSLLDVQIIIKLWNCWNTVETLLKLQLLVKVRVRGWVWLRWCSVNNYRRKTELEFQVLPCKLLSSAVDYGGCLTLKH